MARYDKYDPISGGFRARLAAAWAADDGEIVGVGLDENGRVVPGAGLSGLCGVVVLVGVNKRAGDVVDVMTDGEIVECESLSAGTPYSAALADGALGASGIPIGHTVEAERLVVRVQPSGTSGS